MIRDGYRLLWPDQEPPQCFELAEFLVHNLGIDVLPFNSHETPMNRKVTFHRACHGRGIGLKGEQETLLESAPGLELIPLGEPEQCCGFGGAFSATQGKLSEGIGMEKLRHVVETGADMLVSGDMGCLMHLSGLAKRAGIRLEMRHYLEVLAEALPI
jgi:L-lactate dehydrogenase complex protein LldE